MPEGDGSGPSGQGPETGKGMGKGQGRGRGGGFSAGPGGYCVCPNCGESIRHQVRNPCNEQRCPQCKTAMTRE